LNEDFEGSGTDMTSLPIKQLAQLFNGFLLKSDEFIKFYNKHNDKIKMIYASNEQFTPIPLWVREKMKGIYYIRGKHQAYNERRNSKAFFRLFQKLIVNDVIS
jgi:hypothetical protein